MGSFGNQKGAEIVELEGLQLSGTDSDCIMQPTTQSKLPRRQVMKLAVTVMALSSLLAAAFYFGGLTVALKHNDISLTEELDKDWDELVGLAAETPKVETLGCKSLVLIKNPEVVHNNLGGSGPDTGEEGMIYNSRLFMKDSDGNEIVGKNVKVAVHATSDYDQKNTFNGLHGKFFSILLSSGTNVSFNVSVYDGDTNEPLVLPYFSITFFDLDISEENRSKEYIIAEKFAHYYVANNTQVEVTDNGDGTMKFSATQPGTGKDNPEDSEELELLAKSKGVTLQYLGRSSVDFTVGAEDGKSHRGYLFTLRPSMLCAKTHINGEWVDPLNSSIPGVDLPLMDGVAGVFGMEVPIIHIGENGTVTVVTENGNITLDANSSLADKLIDEKNKDKSKASPKSGIMALLIVMTLLAVVWPLGNLQ